MVKEGCVGWEDYPGLKRATTRVNGVLGMLERIKCRSIFSVVALFDKSAPAHMRDVITCK